MKIPLRLKRELKLVLQDKQSENKKKTNGKYLQTTGNYLTLNVYNMGISQTKLDFILKEITPPGQWLGITCINLNRNRIGNEGAILLAFYLMEEKKHRCLKSLYLNDTDLEDEGAIAIVDSLVNNMSLNNLQLSHNNLTDLFITQSLSLFLKKNNVLKSLWIDGNQFTAAGYESLSNNINHNHSISLLSIDLCLPIRHPLATGPQLSYKENIEANIARNQRWQWKHQQPQLVELALVFGLKLPIYVLLEIVDRLEEFKYLRQIQKVTLFDNVRRSIEKILDMRQVWNEIERTDWN